MTDALTRWRLLDPVIFADAGLPGRYELTPRVTHVPAQVVAGEPR